MMDGRVKGRENDGNKRFGETRIPTEKRGGRK